MPEGKFPEPDEKDKQQIIHALSLRDKHGLAAKLAHIKFIPSPTIIHPKEKSASFDPNEQEVRIRIFRDSVAALICKIIDSKYFNLSIAAEDGTRDGNFFQLKTDSNEDSKTIAAIFSDPIIQVLVMDGTDIDLESIVDMGLDLEKNGALPEGVTKKSYARRLKAEIDRYKNTEKNKKIFEAYEKTFDTYTALIVNGFLPLKNEEATPLIEEAITRLIKERDRDRKKK